MVLSLGSLSLGSLSLDRRPLGCCPLDCCPWIAVLWVAVLWVAVPGTSGFSDRLGPRSRVRAPENAGPHRAPAPSSFRYLQSFLEIRETARNPVQRVVDFRVDPGVGSDVYQSAEFLSAENECPMDNVKLAVGKADQRQARWGSEDAEGGRGNPGVPGEANKYRRFYGSAALRRMLPLGRPTSTLNLWKAVGPSTPDGYSPDTGST